MSNLESPPTQGHVNNFDFLRLLFATQVLITHSYVLTGIPEIDLLAQWTDRQISFSFIAVAGFFVISGYLIIKSLLRSDGFQDYFFKRIIRLFPGLWVAVGLMMVLSYFFSDKSAGEYFTQGSTWEFLRTAVLDIRYHISGVFEHNPDRGVCVNASLWTIPLEVTLYILFSPLLFFKHNKQAVKALVALAFVGLVSAHLLNLIHPFLYYRVLQMELVKLVYLGALFAGGALLAVLFPKLPSAAIRNKTVVVCAIGLVVALATHVYGVATFFLLPPLVIAFGTLNYPSLSWIRKYGDISYGVYIWGYFVQQALVYLFHFNYIWLAVVSIPISWLLGFLSWHLIEKKPLQLKMRKKPQPELVAS